MKAALFRLVGVFSVSLVTLISLSSCSTARGPRTPASSESSGAPGESLPSGSPIQWQVIVDSTYLARAAVVYDCFAYTACVNQHSSLDGPMKVLTIEIESTRQQMLELASRCQGKDYPALVSISEKTEADFIPVVPAAVESIGLEDSNGIALPPVVALRAMSPEQQGTLYMSARRLMSAKKYDQMIDLFIHDQKLESYGCRVSFDPTLKNHNLTNQMDHTITFPYPGYGDSPCENFRTVRHEFEHSYQTTFAAECSRRGQISGFSYHHAHEERERAAHLNDLRNMNAYCERELPGLIALYRTMPEYLLHYRTDGK
ncbi:MAG: hypothetical protein H7222_15385 [Methylotenera sp.]|nr:hypothetical protein [Oligoflexia bacterium]